MPKDIDIHEELVKLRRRIDVLIDATRDKDSAPVMSELDRPYDLIENELRRVGKPLPDHEIVRRLGPQINYGKKDVTIWVSIVENVVRGKRKLVVLKGDQPSSEIVKRTLKMKRAPKDTPIEQCYPGNMIGLAEWYKS